VQYSRRVANQDATEERIPLTAPVMAEGPGGRIFVASLPLREGFKIQYNILDRWNGEGSSRLEKDDTCCRRTETYYDRLGFQGCISW
jgi:hypothetical protein